MITIRGSPPAGRCIVYVASIADRDPTPIAIAAGPCPSRAMTPSPAADDTKCSPITLTGFANGLSGTPNISAQRAPNTNAQRAPNDAISHASSLRPWSQTSAKIIAALPSPATRIATAPTRGCARAHSRAIMPC